MLLILLMGPANWHLSSLTYFLLKEHVRLISTIILRGYLLVKEKKTGFPFILAILVETLNEMSWLLFHLKKDLPKDLIFQSSIRILISALCNALQRSGRSDVWCRVLPHKGHKKEEKHRFSALALKILSGWVFFCAHVFRSSFLFAFFLSSLKPLLPKFFLWTPTCCTEHQKHIPMVKGLIKGLAMQRNGIVQICGGQLCNKVKWSTSGSCPLPQQMITLVAAPVWGLCWSLWFIYF